MPGAATARQRHAVGAEKLSGNLNYFKTSAALARSGFIGGFGFHWLAKIEHPRCCYGFAKFSASATALRMDMDLLTVS